MMRGVRVMTVFFILLLALVVGVVRIGHADGDDSCHCCIAHMTRGSCAGRQNIAVCVCCTPIAAIDTFAAIIFVVG
jgi:hypothetical protein